ncbi:unnamed protein product [Chironomus riparius]|uniref:Uncharacterized protein n=1 Tax=Chironomus riparius TaxID=315576 RepID=A0A9P0IQW8_9DIPT|nr:unnamed protein product [Chironomus riparius]
MDSKFDLPGWATAVDPRSGRQYFINLQEKTTSWEDPRLKYKHVYGPSIPMQTLHGSPKNVQVYPTQSYPTQAFQSHSGQSVNASPVPSTRASHYTSHTNQTVEMSSLSRSSPHTPRVGNLIKHQQMIQQQQQQQHVQETSFTSPTTMETDATVSKINSMFPTASEHHIRLLLKKYHNREAVVISALQVEKHPTHTPGPNTPPPPRSFHSTALALSAFGTPPSSSALSRKALHHLYNDHLTLNSSSINGSPILRPQSSSSYYTSGYYGSPRFGEVVKNSPKPHSSPKMKLRYLKSMFPKCEETIILDILATVDNNVQKASEQLIRMGYEKKEITPAPRLSYRKKEESSVRKQQVSEPTPPPKQKTIEEKKKLKVKLQAQYKESIPERVILMALESVDYSEDKALKILDIVLQEDRDSKQKTEKERKKGDGVEKNVSFKEPSDHTIITTPIESPQTDIFGSSTRTTGKSSVSSKLLQVDYDETPSDGSSNEAIISVDKRKKRQKARSDSTRSAKNESVKETNSKVSTGGSSKTFISKSIVFEENKEGNFMSIVTKSNSRGPNSSLAKGPRDDLLLADYVAWNGANPDIIGKCRIKSNGPNQFLRSERTYIPRGSSSKLCKGPQSGLAIGSIYAQTSHPANVACN